MSAQRELERQLHRLGWQHDLADNAYVAPSGRRYLTLADALAALAPKRPGFVCEVASIPPCDFCKDGTPGPFDFASRLGPWAHGCEEHWAMLAVQPAELGVGRGQLWVIA